MVSKVSSGLALIACFGVILITAPQVLAVQILINEDGEEVRVPTTELPTETDSLLRWERCYGVARRGDEKGVTLPPSYLEPGRYRPTDGDAFAWIDLPFGVCERLVGGSLTPSENVADILDETTQRPISEADAGEELQTGEDIIEQRINDFLYR